MALPAWASSFAANRRSKARRLTCGASSSSRARSPLQSRRSATPNSGAKRYPPSRWRSCNRRCEERNRIENQVEATLEARITNAASDLGLTRSFLNIVWPPVDFEFTDAPRTLVTSPRDRIELRSADLLRADLSLPELEAIENETEALRDVSALAFPIGGVGAYPAIIDYPSDYRRALIIAAHEWTHHYLFFRPLGLHYYSSNDLRTINETVANLVGNEMANRCPAAMASD